LFQENKTIEVKHEASRKNELLALDKYDVDGKDESITVRNEFPHLVPCFQVTKGFDLREHLLQNIVYSLILKRRLRSYDNYPSV
jgi:hypothetical protein